MRGNLKFTLGIFLALIIIALFVGMLYKQKSRVGLGRKQNPEVSNHVEALKPSPKIILETGNVAAQGPDYLKSQLLNSLLQRHRDEEQKKYLEGEEFWKDQLKQYPNDFILIRNAARFFIKGNRELGISTFTQGKSLDDPKNSAVWDRALGDALWLLARSTPQQDALLAKEALKSFERAYAEESNAANRNALLPSMSKAALASGEIPKAVSYATEMLSSLETVPKQLQGDLIYNGNYILGMVAIKSGNIDEATRYLLLSADTPGSGVLSSFGPNMTLAKELLDRGQRDAVLAFLEKCSTFWNGTTSPCSRWIQEIKEGQTPDFSRNLNY